MVVSDEKFTKILILVSCHHISKRDHLVYLDSIFQVSIHLRHEPKCIGSIISAHFIVTTANCLDVHGVKDAPLTDISISEGTTNANEEWDSHQVEQIILHPEYHKAANNEILNDIALIKVRTHFHSGAKVYHVKMFKTGESVPNRTLAELTGFSKADAGLMMELIPVLDNASCATYYPKLGAGQICAGTRGRGPCEGDEGAPLVVADKLIGIASNWLDDCADVQRPAIFTDIANYYDWISSTINSFENDLVVSIQNQQRHQCEGVIISPYHVLTTGLCVRAAFLNELTVRIDYAHAKDEAGRVFGVDHVHLHPNLRIDPQGKPVNDIAILRVKNRFPFIKNKTELSEAQATVTGGVTGQTPISNLSSDGITYIASSVLEVIIVNTEVCNEAYEDLSRTITSDLICANEVENRHWEVTRGAPLFVDDRVVGVLSCYGICKSSGGRPVTYTNVGNHRQWIDDFLTKESENLGF
ncbi:hypothetical protein QAD02_017398 [Eretmocerus hayati]|uniref:Uncharacterized protein n=1 Tax=Eretmocerus hayati TaxID=131215 RepID=A0ACC2PDR7_9HYME|nr:hypothetical protein QAD02_017398 [Eretmocerus hayati]